MDGERWMEPRAKELGVKGWMSLNGAMRKERGNLRRSLLLALLLGVGLYKLTGTCLTAGVAESKSSRNDPVGRAKEGIFDWASLQPSENLGWTECYGSFHCTRLSVPLDYSNPSGETAAVALIKSPSLFVPGDEGYRGPVLFNPGGPGGSGVDLVKELAPTFRTILGDGFDLIGFDPRGVGETTPRLEIFTSALEAGTLFAQYEGSMNASPSAIGRAYAFSHNMGDLALKRTKEVAQHVSTPVVARDMLRIVEAFGQDKLQYWGFSYGTVLGATFASMFPDNVGRLIIDGVVDAENYYAGLWSNNLMDTDLALEDILNSCIRAGPDKCPFYEPNVSDIQKRIDKLLDRLRVAPISVQATRDGWQEIVDYAMLRQVLFMTLYHPHNMGARLTRALAELEQGNGSLIYAVSPRRAWNDLLTCNCREDNSFDAFYDKSTAISCGDAHYSPDNLDELRNAYEEMARTSTFAEVWPERMFCAGWKIKGKERFHGSFDKAVKTSHPLLLIGNTADPVTPLRFAHKMAKGFKDAVVLAQNSSGHCSISATSLCTAKIIRSYFINGTLPELDTVCQVESSIFDDAMELEIEASEEDKLLLAASRVLQERYPIALPKHGKNLK